MSKPVTRIVLTILISLAILAGVYTTVYGAAFSAGASQGRFQVTAGLLPDLSHTRMAASTAATNSYFSGLAEQETFKSPGGCSDEAHSSMDD